MTFPRDPGLQPERTLLAWRRTNLCLVAIGLLLVRGGVHEHRAVLLSGACVVVLVGGALTLIVHWRQDDLTARASPPPLWLFRATTALVVFATVVATWSVSQR
jgi:uncharacterized membrane protein YidH (DUF202 family)